jgi:hypothetical protein
LVPLSQAILFLCLKRQCHVSNAFLAVFQPNIAGGLLNTLFFSCHSATALSLQHVFAFGSFPGQHSPPTAQQGKTFSKIVSRLTLTMLCVASKRLKVSDMPNCVLIFLGTLRRLPAPGQMTEILVLNINFNTYLTQRSHHYQSNTRNKILIPLSCLYVSYVYCRT